MRLSRHWTLRYLFYRAAEIWYRRRHPQHPWLTPQAVSLLQGWLTPADKGIEWGTGKSTVWLAERIAQLVSVEHDPVWYEKTALRLREGRLSGKVDYRLVPVTDGRQPNAPSREDDNPGPQEYPYACVVDDYPDEFFDLALVDGKIRHVCVERVLPKLRAGGLLILDNAERYLSGNVDGQLAIVSPGTAGAAARASWTSSLQKLTGWRRITTSNGIWETSFWIKP